MRAPIAEALALLRQNGMHLTAAVIEQELARLDDEIIGLQTQIIHGPVTTRTCALCLAPITAGYCRCL